MKHAGNFAFDRSLSFVKALAACGLRNAVISPGSRSTPLTLAFSAHPSIKKSVVLDERSAGFIALGMGKATGIPAAIVCTSGTAAANYYPAIIEAAMSETPLLVLTADRPAHLRAVGAAQAIDQVKLFGSYPRFFFELGEPHETDDDLHRLILLAEQAYEKARTEKSPVHLNFAFRKPLEPDPGHYRRECEKIADESIASGKVIVDNEPPGPEETRLPDRLTDRIRESRRPVIICSGISSQDGGRGPVDLAEKLNAPLITEVSSQLAGSRKQKQLPFIFGFDAFLKNEPLRQKLRPDLILRFGDTIISKGLELWLKTHRNIDQVVLSTSGERKDPTLTAAQFYKLHSYEFATDSIPPATNKKWLEEWDECSARHQKAVQAVMGEDRPFTDGQVHHHISSEIPDDWLVMLSNSFPVRDFDLFGYPFSGNGPVIVNRGASGIDGVTSTFLGAVSASQKNGILVTGDLAFLHDANALLSAEKLVKDQTAIILVVNNRGGSIFRMLPIAEQQEIFSAYFETPQQVDIRALCKAYGVEYKMIEDFRKLIATFKELCGKPGFAVIECVTDAEHSMEVRRKLSR